MGINIIVSEKHFIGEGVVIDKGDGSFSFSKGVDNLYIDFGPAPGETITTDEFYCWYKNWSEQSEGDSDLNEDITIQAGGVKFGNFRIYKTDGNSSQNTDIVLIRKKDRACIRIQGDLSYPSSLSFTLIDTYDGKEELKRLKYWLMVGHNKDQYFG